MRASIALAALFLSAALAAHLHAQGGGPTGEIAGIHDSSSFDDLKQFEDPVPMRSATLNRTGKLTLSRNQDGTDPVSADPPKVYVKVQALRQGQGVRGGKIMATVSAQRGDTDGPTTVATLNLKTDKDGRASGSVPINKGENLVTVEIDPKGGKKVDRFKLEVSAGRMTDCQQGKACLRFRDDGPRYEISVTWTPEGGQTENGALADTDPILGDSTQNFGFSDHSVSVFMGSSAGGVFADQVVHFNNSTTRPGTYQVRVRCVGGSYDRTWTLSSGGQPQFIPIP